MTEDELFFFNTRMDALPLYEALRERLLAAYPGAEIRAQKTQISFYDGHMFTCVSFLPVRGRGRGITVTFSGEEAIASPRVAACAQVSPHRVTHHVPVAGPEDIDGELMGWIAASHALAQRGKKRGKMEKSP